MRSDFVTKTRFSFCDSIGVQNKTTCRPPGADIKEIGVDPLETLNLF